MEANKVGEFLKALRKSKGLTQIELADMFNVSNKTVSKWETSLGIPEISTLVMLADFYEVSVDDILRGSKKMLKDDDKTILRLDYIINKSKSQYLNHLLINYSILVISIFILFIIGNLTDNSTVAKWIVVIAVILMILLQVLNINRLRYQIIEIEEQNIKGNLQRFVFNTSYIFFSFLLWLTVFSNYYNLDTTTVTLTGYNIFITIIPSFGISCFIALIVYMFIRLRKKISFLPKISKTAISFITVSILLLFVPFVIVSVMPAKELAIKLDLSSLVYIFYDIDTQEEGYYRLKLIKIIVEEHNGSLPPPDNYEIIMNDQTYKLEIHYEFPDGYLLITDYDYLIFSSYLGYSNFEINEQTANAYMITASNEQLRLESYTFLITGLIQMYFTIGLVILLVKYRKR